MRERSTTRSNVPNLAVFNKTYTIQQSEALGAPWTKLTDILARTNNPTQTITGLIAPTNRPASRNIRQFGLRWLDTAFHSEPGRRVQ